MFLTVDWVPALKFAHLLGDGIVMTLTIFFLTLLFALPLGLLVALGRMSVNRFVRGIFKVYIRIMRGTPLILQIVFIYFAPAYILPKFMNYDRYTAAVIAFALNYAAYFAEIYRGGIQSIPKGQYEAAQVLGFSRAQTFIRIVMPQVIKRILPPISNEVITLVKDTALVQIIGISELFRAAQGEATRLFSTTPLFVAGVIYFLLNWAVEKGMHYCEKKLDYYR